MYLSLVFFPFVLYASFQISQAVFYLENKDLFASHSNPQTSIMMQLCYLFKTSMSDMYPTYHRMRVVLGGMHHVIFA